MELDFFVDRFITCLKELDVTDSVRRYPRKAGQPPYLPGISTIPEGEATSLVGSIWTSTHPSDFGAEGYLRCEVPYPHSNRQKCDYVLRSATHDGPNAEWAVEVKKLAFIGDNGKNNDHAVQKLLSPYLKDRSLIHDIDRLQGAFLAERKAVIGYAFKYSFATCEEAEHRHPDEADRIREIRKVCNTNDPINGLLDPLDMVRWADEQFRRSGKVASPLLVKTESGFWRHPCGGTLVVFGWELP